MCFIRKPTQTVNNPKTTIFFTLFYIILFINAATLACEYTSNRSSPVLERLPANTLLIEVPQY